MDTFWQFGYEIEARRDWDGAFPLRCAALRFVSLHLNEDIIIKKRNTRWSGETEVLQKYAVDGRGRLERHPRCPDTDFLPVDTGTRAGGQEELLGLCMILNR